MSLEAIKTALDQARAAAGAAVPPATTSVPTTGNAIQAGRPVSMREMLAQSTSMSVKAYLKVDRVAFLIGKSDELFKEFEVEFRINEAKPFFGLRYGQSPAKYERSLDRLTNSKNGRSWTDCIQEAQRLDSRCRGDYPAVDVPYTLVKDILDTDKKTVLVEAGEKIGWTSSITNYAEFRDFIMPYYSLIDNGVLAEDALLRGKIVHAKRKGSSEAYGALTFVGFEPVDNGSLQPQ